jgi:hypothetical protein
MKIFRIMLTDWRLMQAKALLQNLQFEEPDDNDVITAFGDDHLPMASFVNHENRQTLIQPSSITGRFLLSDINCTLFIEFVRIMFSQEKLLNSLMQKRQVRFQHCAR